MKPAIDFAWDDKPVDVTAEVNQIWTVANRLRGVYQSDKYKNVIIPMTILRRFECALAPRKASVVKYFEDNPGLPAIKYEKISGYPFYCTSRFDLRELLNDPDNIAANLREYIKGFSPNIREIMENLEFDTEIKKMDESDRLFSVVQAYSALDLDPATIDSVKMGYVFEDLIRRFSENAEAGDHYTGRDIGKLMADILLAEGADDVLSEPKIVPVIDQASGTGGLLSTMFNFIRHHNQSADVCLFGQEINPESYAICLAEMLIKGQDAANVRKQDTMKADCFPDQKMRFVIENPPFGTAWAGKDAPTGTEAAVRAEYGKGLAGRWGAGLPSGGDMQLLFVQSAVDKLADDGRAAIIENGSPLFAGGVASGESQTRRWLLERDLLEAIVALPTDLFYNTGIATYIWVLSKNKAPHRKGKVQLIDATSFCKPLRKSLGNKRVEITPEDRKAVTGIYSDFTENEFCQIHPNEAFLYREYSVMQPLQRSYGFSRDRIDAMLASGALDPLYDQAKVDELEGAGRLSAKDAATLQRLRDSYATYVEIIDALSAQDPDALWMEPKGFSKKLAEALAKVTGDPKLLARIACGLSRMDKRAEIQRDRKGAVIWDKASKDTETVPCLEDIDVYMAREVLPHVPDAKAFFEEDLKAKKPVVKTGAELPFTRFFYKYEKPRPSREVLAEIAALDAGIASGFATLAQEAR